MKSEICSGRYRGRREERKHTKTEKAWRKKKQIEGNKRDEGKNSVRESIIKGRKERERYKKWEKKDRELERKG